MLRPFSIAMTALLLSTAFLSEATAQRGTAVTSPRVETELSKVVVFITVELKTQDRPNDPHPTGGAVPSLQGTGFLISVPDSRLPNGEAFGYLVTNRHLAEAIEQDGEGGCVRHEIRSTYLTFNLKNPANGERAVRLELSLSPQYHWYFPSDESVDLAVIPFGPPARICMTSSAYQSSSCSPRKRSKRTTSCPVTDC